MKNCQDCGKRVYRQQPDGAEYGIAVVDGQPYPDDCPECGAAL